MGTARIFTSLSVAELSAREKLANQSGFSVYYADSRTLIESKVGPDIEKIIDPLTFMITLEKDWYRERQWIIPSKESDELIGYRVEILNPNSLALSTKYGKPSNGSFAISQKEFKEFEEALETKSLEKVQTTLHKFAAKRLINAVRDEILASSPASLKQIAREAEFLQCAAGCIARASADKKLTQSTKLEVPSKPSIC